MKTPRAHRCAVAIFVLIGPQVHRMAGESIDETSDPMWWWHQSAPDRRCVSGDRTPAGSLKISTCFLGAVILEGRAVALSFGHGSFTTTRTPSK